LEPQLVAVVDRDVRGHVVPYLAFAQVEYTPDPVVQRFFQVRQVDGLVDVLIGVEVAPTDLDALLVHGRIGYAHGSLRRKGRARHRRRPRDRQGDCHEVRVRRGEGGGRRPRLRRGRAGAAARDERDRPRRGPGWGPGHSHTTV